jgi:hypothetical protein
MKLEGSDFFAWYNTEITRYRDHEWQLVSYSVGLSSAIVLFARATDTKGIIAPWAAGLAIATFVTVLIVAQIHTHLRLNQYRERRRLLLDSKDHREANVRSCLIRSWFDGFYLLAFVLLPATFGGAAVYVLL